MVDNLEQSPRDGSTREARDYFQTQRNALRELLELSSDVVTPLEEEIERRLQESQKTAEQALAEVRSQIESRFQKKRAEAEHSYAELVKQAEVQYESARTTLAARAHESREGFAAQAREIEKQARREREDDLLMAETVFQSTIEGLRKDFAALKRDLAARRQRLDTLGEQAARLLDEHRCETPGNADVPEGELVKLEDPAAAYDQHVQAATKHLAALRRLSMPPMSIGAGRFLLLALLNLAPIGTLSVLSLRNVAGAPPLVPWGPIALGVTLIVSWIIGRALSRRARARLHARIRRAHKPFRLALAAAGQALGQHLEHASQELKRDEAETTERRDQETEAVHGSFDTLIAETDRRRAESLQRLDATTTEQQNGIQRRHDSILGQAAGQRDDRLRRYREQHDHDLTAAQQRCERQVEGARRRHASERSTLEAGWKTGLAEIRQLLEDVDQLKRLPHVDWDAGLPADWVAPQEFKAFIPFGNWHVDLTHLAPSVGALAPFLDDRAALIEVPALLAIPTRCSLFLQTERAGRQEAIDTLRAVMLRLLTSLPPGRVHFTILDPVGLGENFAGFMHLVDYEEKLVGGRIWTESEHIEARLTELTSHMENVIQKYLRNEFATIDEYNAQAGELVEPYRFLVIADFPANFNEGAARRLTSIVNSGARCGVFTLIAHDQRLPTPAELHIEDLAGESAHLVYENDRFVHQDDVLRQFPLTLDTPPSEEILTSILHVVGRHAKDSLRVEVPFESVAPTTEQCWANDSRSGISMPLGHTGAVRLQNLRLGRGLAQHGLIAGKTGSGKSTLLHVIITNLALWYSPDEVELYLVDFKKGVEFKTYVTHQLPHARAIAVESDREFGVSVLQRLDAELARRGDLFRAAGVQDLPAYREATGERLPRTLLIVDEFQVFFAEDDRLSQEAALLLDRLVRQGRAFGIHVLLGSQTLGGASSLARSTIGQMAVRIALQCSEADSQLILDDNNVAARLLSRPGEAIYNDAGGLVEGNSPFQTAWLPDRRRQVYLQRVRDLARQRKVRVEPAVVFEGNAPADIRQNRLLAALIESADWPKMSNPRAWLGEAVAIKDPSNVVFKRQSGANLLFVGQRDAAVAAMLAATIISLGAQHPSDAARLIILETRPVDTAIPGQLHKAAATLPHQTRFIAWRDVAKTITELAHEVQRRVDADQTDAPAIYLLINGLHRYRMLRRQEDDFAFSSDDTDQPPALDRQFADVLRDGPPFGIHTIAWCDTLASLERTLDRQSISEFDNRVLFQMSAADSANLIDTPEANKLGFYRALLYSVEHGLVEKLRPYATPDAEWLEHVTRCLQRKPG